MQVFNEKLYFGVGNSSNKGPAPNAKGGEVWGYDPDMHRFNVEYETSEEQVDRYRVLDGNLYIPGHDPTDSWDLGNWYRLEPEGWKKYRNLPAGIHCYDIFSFRGNLFAALGVKSGSDIVVMSENGGKTWKGCGPVDRGRAYAFFTVGDRLYVSHYRGIAQFDGNVFLETAGIDWFPGQIEHPTGQKRIRLVVRSVVFKEHTLYIGAFRVNDHQWTPFGLYGARSPEKVTKVDLPGRLWDIIVREERRRLAEKKYRYLLSMGQK